jgi:hypothetical protein
MSWDFTAHWFASFGGVDQRLPEQRRNGAGPSAWLMSYRSCLILCAVHGLVLIVFSS